MHTAEYQMWLAAAKREKKRVDEIHEEAKSKGKKSTAQFLLAKVEKPWVWSRSGPGSLFDIHDGLINSVVAFDYSLSDQNFVKFLERAAQLHICRRPNGEYWNLLDDKATKRSDFLRNEKLAFSQEHEEKRHKYSDAEMESFWRIFSRTRVYLQGAFDCYRGRETTALQRGDIFEVV